MTALAVTVVAVTVAVTAASYLSSSAHRSQVTGHRSQRTCHKRTLFLQRHPPIDPSVREHAANAPRTKAAWHSPRHQKRPLHHDILASGPRGRPPRRPLESNDRLAVRGERAKELEPRGERADTESERLRENLDQEIPVTEPGRRTWTRVNWVGQDKS